MKIKVLTFIMFCLYNSMSVHAQTTELWGTANAGGANDSGAIFKSDANGNNFQIVYSFVGPDGSMPRGNVVLANNCKLYGITDTGGFGDSCVVYSYDLLTGIYTKVYDFYQNTLLGWNAKSGMMKASDGTLYGLCNAGGAVNGGAIYKIDPLTDNYTDVYDFNGADGMYPEGTLIQLSNGKLYGMTSAGGTNFYGVIFSFDPAVSAYAKLYDFDWISGGDPAHGGLLQASNSKLYGMTNWGGTNGYGVIFSYDITTYSYTDLHDFDGIHGRYPRGSLMQASNGTLYGMTSDGGTSNNGILFSFDIATNNYVVLFNFNGLNGSEPQRGLTQATNGKLFGTTRFGGSTGNGVAFSYDITAGVYAKLVDFDYSTIGGNPDCELLEIPINCSTGIPVINETQTVTICPNPATNSLTVTGAGNDDVIQFIDISGKKLTTIKIASNSKTTMDISHFPNEFFVRGLNGVVKKMVKQ